MAIGSRLQGLQTPMRFHPAPWSALGYSLQVALMPLAQANSGQFAPNLVDADELIDAEPRMLIELQQAAINHAVETARGLSRQIGQSILG